MYEKHVYMWILNLLSITVKHEKKCVQFQCSPLRKCSLLRKKLGFIHENNMYLVHIFHNRHNQLVVHDEIGVHMDINQGEYYKYGFHM